MRRIRKLNRQAFEKNIERQAALVSVSDLHEGDIVEFFDVQYARRFGRVYHIRPRARRVVVGSPMREDYPRGWKELAKYNHWRMEISEKQLISIYRKGARRAGHEPSVDVQGDARAGRPL